MNRGRVYELASEALAARAGVVLERDGGATADPPEHGGRASGWKAPYDRAAFLFDLSCQLAEAGNGPKPASDEEWAEAVVRSYLARTAVKTAAAARR